MFVSTQGVQDVVFESQCLIQVQSRVSKRTGNAYEVVSLLVPKSDGSYESLILTMDRSTVNEVKIRFLKDEI